MTWQDEDRPHTRIRLRRVVWNGTSLPAMNRRAPRGNVIASSNESFRSAAFFNNCSSVLD